MPHKNIKYMEVCVYEGQPKKNHADFKRVKNIFNMDMQWNILTLCVIHIAAMRFKQFRTERRWTWESVRLPLLNHSAKY